MAKKKKVNTTGVKKMTEKKDDVKDTPVVDTFEGGEIAEIEVKTSDEENAEVAVEKEVAKMPAVKSEKKDDITLSVVSEMIGARKELFRTTACFNKQDAIKLDADIARIAIEAFESGEATELQALLDYMAEFPSQISDVVSGMDATIKNGERQRMAVTHMYVAFKRIVTAEKTNNPVQINLQVIADAIYNKPVISFIASKVG